MTRPLVNVLYVEDDVMDADLARTVLRDIQCDFFNLQVVEDGDQALKLFEEWEKSPPSMAADLILLDLNLPKVHGKDVLKAVKSSDRLKGIPVIVLSTSRVQLDIDDVYKLGAAGFFSKPADYEECKAVFKAICDYWIGQARLPARAT